MSEKLFEAIKNGDVERVKALTENSDTDVNVYNERGFTPLQTACFRSNSLDADTAMQIIKLLVEAGALLNVPSKEADGYGRTAVFLAAEFSPDIQPIKYLIEQGADPSIHKEGFPNIVDNAMEEDVQQYLSEITGFAIPATEDETEHVPLTKRQWKKAQNDLKKVFQSLNEANIVALQKAGYTQQDGFQDCVEICQEKIDNNQTVAGICFYTEQDMERALDTGLLSLDFWGYPEGSDEDTIAVGRLITEIFEQHSFTVNWDGSADLRPEVVLYGYAKKLFKLF